MANETAVCSLCGEPMPPNEQMFKYHGYSGPCPKPPLPRARPAWIDAAAKECASHVLACVREINGVWFGLEITPEYSGDRWGREANGKLRLRYRVGYNTVNKRINPDKFDFAALAKDLIEKAKLAVENKAHQERLDAEQDRMQQVADRLAKKFSRLHFDAEHGRITISLTVPVEQAGPAAGEIDGMLDRLVPAG